MAELIEVPSGLEGVIAFDTSIAEPDREGGSLRYRGVNIEDLVGRVPFEKVWGLLVDGHYEPGLPPAGRTRWRSARAIRGLTCSLRWRCWRRSGACPS